MVDALDSIESDSDDGDSTLPPLPPGLVMPPPPLDFSPHPSPPQFGFPAELSGDGDLLDAANSLEDLPKPNLHESAPDFKSVWENRKASDPTIGSGTRDSMYGQIDRIASGKSGSLMDRFSDRFGSELDREIIVLRKKEQQDLRSIKPTVELISVPEEGSEMSFSEFLEAMDDEEFVDKVSEATGISTETLYNLDLNSLKSFFDKADVDDSGTLDFSEFVVAIQSYRSSDEEFHRFFVVINSLLGEMPDDFTNSFIESESFELFQQVGRDPQRTDNETRAQFFGMINDLLGDLPDAVVQNFVESTDFELYKMVADRYGG
jgi:hypothetical protein